MVNGGLANSPVPADAFLQKYSLMEGFPFAEIDVLQLGFYVRTSGRPATVSR